MPLLLRLVRQTGYRPAEDDALAGLSQQAGCAQPTSATPGENGHGCGHNLLGTAAFAAAIAVKKWLEQYGQGGTVRFYGCPGEEGGSGKTFMVREGVFDDVDAALTWHPGSLCRYVQYPHAGKHSGIMAL